MMNRKVFSTGLLAALCVLITGCSDVTFVKDFGKDTVFRVGEETGSEEEFSVFYDSLGAEYTALYGEDIWNTEGLEETVKENALERLFRVKVLTQMAGESVTLTAGEENAAAQAASDYISQSGASDLSLEDLAALAESCALAQKEYDSIIAAADTEVSDDEARSVDVQFIFTAEKDRADSILQEIRDGMANLTGVTFDTYIARYSEADTSEMSISQADEETDSAIKDAAFSLEEGKISDVVEASDGYYILKNIGSSSAEEISANKERIAKKRGEDAFASAYDSYAAGLDYYLDEEKFSSVTRHTDGRGSVSFFSLCSQYLGTDPAE